jgi:hypothetical protein
MPSDTDSTIRKIEFELEKAEHGMALPYDAERVGQLRSMLREARKQKLFAGLRARRKRVRDDHPSGDIGPNHRTLRGARRPVMAITKCPIVMPPVNRFTVAPRALSQHRRTSDWMVRSLA